MTILKQFKERKEKESVSGDVFCHLDPDYVVICNIDENDHNLDNLANKKQSGPSKDKLYGRDFNVRRIQHRRMNNCKLRH